MWDASKCNLCGDCLVRCQYVNYTREKAIQEITSLIEDKDAEILRECVTCQACNEYCKRGADPWDLICHLQHERGSLLPIVPEKTIKQMMETLPSLPGKVTPGDSDKPVLDLGLTGPFYRPQGQLFDGLGTIRGGDYYPYIATIKIGMGHPTKEMVERFAGNLGKVGAKEIVFTHPDDYAMAILARHYGIELSFRPVHIFEYLYNYLKDHQAAITRLNMKIAYQRNCVSRYMPDQEVFLDAIFGLIGVERVARKYDREDALCCGGLGFWPEKFAKIADMNLSDAKEHGAEAMVMVCFGCREALGKACEERGIPPIYVHDLCRMALGEVPKP